MAAVVESKSEVLEDSIEAMLPESKAVEGEEFVELDPAKKEKEEKAQKQGAKKEPGPQTEDELPEDLRGKTPAQLAKMLQETKLLVGRQGQELGEFRRKADLLIHASLENLRAAKQTPEKKEEAKPEEIDESEFFAKPKDAISKMIEAHPVIKEIRATLGKSAADQAAGRAEAATARFNAAHPDAAQIMDDPEFKTWVQASRVRTALLARAHKQFDFDAGDEVFSTWKALKGIGAKQAEESEVKAAAQTLARARQTKAAAQAAAAPTSGASAGKSEGGAKKIYRRADVIRLMEEEPDRYEALAPELELAYREGRVR